MRQFLLTTAALFLLVPLALGLAGTSWAQDNTDTFSFEFTAIDNNGALIDPPIPVTGSFTAAPVVGGSGTEQRYELQELLSVSVDGTDYGDANNFPYPVGDPEFDWDIRNCSVTGTKNTRGAITFILGVQNILSLRVFETPRPTASVFRGSREDESFSFSSENIEGITTTIDSTPPCVVRPPSPPPEPPSPPEVPPMLERAVIDGDMLVLTYSEDLDEDSVPDTEDFTVTASGEAVEVSDVEVSEDIVTLTLESEVEAGDTVTISYTPRDDPIREAEEGELAAAPLVNRTVRNDTEPTDRPDPPTAGDGGGGGCALAETGGSGVDPSMLFLLAASGFFRPRILRPL